MPTQPKLLALATWLGVSAQWLRFGTGEKVELALPPSGQQTGLLVLGKEYAGVISLVDKLVRLSPRDIQIVESVVNTMTQENEST